MSEASAIDRRANVPAPAGPRRLAEWTKLDLRAVRSIYRTLQGNLPEMSRVERALLDHPADPRGEPFASILALCEAAQAAGRLGEFCVAIANSEVDDYGRDRTEANDIVELIGGGGTPHAVLARARGMANPRELAKLMDIFKATARVTEAGGRIVGTAFLIKPDVALTCAHVALARRQNGAAVTYEPARGLKLVFPETDGGEQVASIVDVPVSAPPYVNENGNLITRCVPPEAGNKLDFALLKLDRVIDGAKPVPIGGVPSPAVGPLAFVIGYPGGSQPAMDANQLREVIPDGFRVIHSMNAVAGMSGSCCTGEGAVPIGLHEGAIPELGPNGRPTGQEVNRAILLNAISAAIDRQAEKVVQQLMSPRLLIQKASLVQQLGRRGQQLCGEALLPDWNRAYQDIVGDLPDAATVRWLRHPILGSTKGMRRKLTTWLRTAPMGHAFFPNKVAVVTGPQGCGKSFSIDLLEASLTSPERDLFRLEGMAPDRSLLALGQALSAQLPPDYGTRTRDGQLRYDTVEDLVNALSVLGRRDRSHDPQAHPLFIAIDAGENVDAFANDSDGWLQFTLAIAKASWSRLLICGLSNDSVSRLDQALANDLDTTNLTIFDVGLRHLTGDDVADFLKANGQLDGKPFEEAKIATARDGFDSGSALHAHAPNLATAEAALLAISMLKVPEPEAGTA